MTLLEVKEDFVHELNKKVLVVNGESEPTSSAIIDICQLIFQRGRTNFFQAFVRCSAFWYKWWIQLGGRSPQRAATNLMGLSNTRDYDAANKREDKIKFDLNLFDPSP